MFLLENLTQHITILASLRICYSLVITFSKHAEWKFEVLRKHGIILDKKIIEDTITKPALLLQGMKETMIAQKVLDETHLLRVIHTRKDNDIRVITFYLARRERYEDKV